MQELDSDRQRQLHYVPLAVVEEQARHDVRSNFSVRWIGSTGHGTPQVVAETRFQQPDQVLSVVLDGPGLPDGRRQPGDANLDQALVVVVAQEIRLRDDVLHRGQDLRQVLHHVTILQAEQIASLQKESWELSPYE